MEYYSVLKSSGILIHAITWMASEILIMLALSQTQEEIYCMILLIQGT